MVHNMVKKTKSKSEDMTVEDVNDTDNIQPENLEEDSSTSSADSSDQYEELRKKLLKEYEAQKGDDSIKEDKNQPINDEGYEEPTVIDDLEDESYEEPTMDEHSEASDDEEPTMDEYSEASDDEEQPEEDQHVEQNDDDESFEYTSDNLDNDLGDVYNNTAPDVDQGKSSVAISSKKSLAMMVILGLVVIYILYKVLKPVDQIDDSSQIDKNAPITVPVADNGQAVIVPEIPEIPAVPKLSAPTPPPAPTPPMVSDLSIVQAPVAPPIVATPTTVVQKEDPEEAARRKARLTSGIMVGSDSSSSKNKNVTKDGKSLSILARNNDQIVATSIGDLRRVIAQGKVLDAVLETAINTDLSGSARAIVSRDVYSESGKNILIPRGSRLLGDYSSTVTFGINRVKVTWSRLIRPDGVDISIASPGIDEIGHAGVAGELDNHVARSMSIAVLTSVIDIAAAIYADKQAEPTTVTSTVQPTTGITSTTNPDGTVSATQAASTGSTVTSGTINNEQQAYMDAVDNIGSVGKGILDKTNGMKPTITIDQGTALKVFVNKDLVFPGKSANLTRLVE
jgi:type IV secretion system protein VirB10